VTQQSVVGHIVKLGQASISSNAKKEHIVFCLSIETEYYVMALVSSCGCFAYYD